MPAILCEDLKNKSLRMFLKQQKIVFQGKGVKLGELIEADEIKGYSLNQILELKIVGIELKKPDPYYERLIFAKNHLNPEIQKDFHSGKFDEFITCNEIEYERFILSNIEAHLIEISDFGETIWKKSSKSVEKLRIYKDKAKTSTSNEGKFLISFETATLIMGKAGLGKSKFLENVVFRIKESKPNYWVQNVELKAFYRIG